MATELDDRPMEPATTPDFDLPPALARLTMQELLARLRRSLDSEDLGWGLLLVHEFLRLVRDRQAIQPGTPATVYRAALLAASDGETLRPRRIVQSPVELGDAVEAVLLATAWLQVVGRHLPRGKRSLVAPITKVLCDILHEPSPTAH